MAVIPDGTGLVQLSLKEPPLTLMVPALVTLPLAWMLPPTTSISELLPPVDVEGELPPVHFCVESVTSAAESVPPVLAWPVA